MLQLRNTECILGIFEQDSEKEAKGLRAKKKQKKHTARFYKLFPNPQTFSFSQLLYKVSWCVHSLVQSAPTHPNCFHF